MIKTRQDLRDWLREDARNYYLQQLGWWQRFKAHLFDTPISDQTVTWAYIRTMRHLEYHTNNHGFLHRLAQLWYAHRLRRLSYKTGFQIPPNTCGRGLTIWHWGPIIINPAARLGDHCTLQPMVVIGHKEAGKGAPRLLNNINISGGVKIIGAITIGNNVTIAPGACVCKDVPADCTVGGVPAKIIRSKRSQE